MTSSQTEERMVRRVRPLTPGERRYVRICIRSIPRAMRHALVFLGGLVAAANVFGIWMAGSGQGGLSVLLGLLLVDAIMGLPLAMMWPYWRKLEARDTVDLCTGPWSRVSHEDSPDTYHLGSLEVVVPAHWTAGLREGEIVSAEICRIEAGWTLESMPNAILLSMPAGRSVEAESHLGLLEVIPRSWSLTLFFGPLLGSIGLVCLNLIRKDMPYWLILVDVALGTALAVVVVAVVRHRARRRRMQRTLAARLEQWNEGEPS